MVAPLLATKLYLPPPRAKAVPRPRLVARLHEGRQHPAGVTLISAPAGFGKTTLVSDWVAELEAQSPPVRTAWLSLDEGDNDPSRFLAYLIAALQTVAPAVGAGLAATLASPQPPPAETILTALLNDLAALPDPFVLVLDDYHLIEAPVVDQAVGFLIEHLPPPLHLALATREDPALPLARLRARGQLTELRAADLRFTPAEAAEFLNRVMGLSLAAGEVEALETRTEGWIAGLQLAALSMRGHPDTAGFIQSFTGSHYFVLDYLVEEVLRQQPAALQTFLMRTSVLDRLCGPLCEAVLDAPAATGQATLEQLERANLFIVRLDDERRWYRYHHLFADLLRQRLRQSGASAPGPSAAELHQRASQWYEDHNLELEAFRHAVAAHDVDRADRLSTGKGIPLHVTAGVKVIVDWLASLPPSVLNARPWLWARHGALLLVMGETTGVAEKLDAAEAHLPPGEPTERVRFLIGQIAAARATLALTRYQVADMLTQSRRALEFLPPAHQSLRSNAYWTMGFAHFVLGDRVASGAAFRESIAISQAGGHMFALILATIGLGNVQAVDLHLPLAAETFQRVLDWAGDHPQQIIHDPHLGLGRIHYEWNDLAAAERHGREALRLALQYDARVIDRFILCEIFLARVWLAQGDVAGAAAQLAQTEQTARQPQFAHRRAEIATAQVPVLIRQGELAAAAALTAAYPLPLSQAQVQLAQDDPTAALATLAPWLQHVEQHGWHDERLRALVVQAVAQQALGELPAALATLAAALALAEPSGLVRSFVDAGPPMAALLAAAAAQGMAPSYVPKLLAAFGAEPQPAGAAPATTSADLIEPLSQRELEILQLVADGLSNHEISSRLFLALSTVKGHLQNTYDKLHVQRRTEAVARARALGLL